METENNTTKEQLEFEDIKSELDAIVASLGEYNKDMQLNKLSDIASLAKSYGIYDNLAKIYEVSKDKDIPSAIAVEVAKMGGAAAGAWAGVQIGALSGFPVVALLGGAVGAFAGEQGVAQYENEIRDLAGNMLNDAQGLLAVAAWGMADALSDLFNSAQGWMPPRRGDPLILDLDGDGIETIGIGTTNNVFFDTNGDGVKTATGWVGKDDGLLVLDRNGNATIDNGGELFGDQTLVNGVKATDGFAALSAEDSNANGIFDANDTNFNNVRLWQDLNQNGISETNELSSLNANAITSIGLSYEASSIISNNNLYALKGTYQKDKITANNLNFTNERSVV